MVSKVDIIDSDGIHYYWSTHCRHGNSAPPWDDRHGACKATQFAPGVARQPSQCKTCGAPCNCDCHKENS